MIWRKFKNLIKSNDLFSSREMFRYDNEMEYKSLTGGILSLGVIITVLIGFANMIILTMKREIIISQKHVQVQSVPTLMTLKVAPENNFMMAFQIFDVNLTALVRYFDYELRETIVDGGYLISQTSIPLVQCTRQHWAQLPQVVASYESLNIGNWVCPQIGFNLKLFGKYSSPDSSEYIFHIKTCVNSTNITCASPEQIKQFFIDYKSMFSLTYYFVNSIINQNSKDYITYYLQDSRYIMFGDKLGSQAYIYFSDFQIQTDISIWPFQTIETVRGSVMQSWVDRAFQQLIIFIRINKSSNSIKYNRHVQKISTVFSFIGGMISAVSAVLFIIKTYNSQAFQIEIASSIFTDSPESEQLQHNNFWSYLKYNLYKFRKFIGCKYADQNYNLLQNCLQEIGKQLDIKLLIQRIIFLQHCLSFIFQDYQLLSIQTKRPSSFSSIKKVRQRCNQTENEIVKEALLDSSQLKSQSDNQSSVRNLDLRANRENFQQKSRFNIKRENLFIDDIISQVPQKEMKISNKVANCSILFQKQRASLRALQKNAYRGDRVSLKIYNHLHEQNEEPKIPLSRFSTDK